MNFVYYLHDEVNQNEFEQKLLWLKNRYNIISVDKLREHIYDGVPLKNSCVLSVDDGWCSTYDVIYPVMKKYNVPFTIFVSPYVMEENMNFWYYTMRFCNQDELKGIMIRRGYFAETARKYPCELLFKEILIDEVYDVLSEYLKKHPDLYIPRGFMNTTEVVELHNSGLVEVGAHTLIHPILKVESDERSRREIHQSVDKLSALLNNKVSCFAYPNGLENVDFGDRELTYAKQAGIDMAFSVNPGKINSQTNPLSIPRWGSISRLKCGLFGQYLPSRENQVSLRNEIRKLALR